MEEALLIQAPKFGIFHCASEEPRNRDCLSKGKVVAGGCSEYREWFCLATVHLPGAVKRVAHVIINIIFSMFSFQLVNLVFLFVCLFCICPSASFR